MKQLLIFLLSLTFSLLAVANDNRPNYEMRGMFTDIWDQDVDYYSPPILLTRTSKTAQLHRVQFDVNSYHRYCEYWENRCVEYDSHGRCIRWERVCARWGYQIEKVPKQVEINMRKASVLGQDEQELYELSIQKVKPMEEGEDRVFTFLKAVNVVKPVFVKRLGNYNYSIEVK